MVCFVIVASIDFAVYLEVVLFVRFVVCFYILFFLSVCFLVEAKYACFGCLFDITTLLSSLLDIVSCSFPVS